MLDEILKELIYSLKFREEIFNDPLIISLKESLEKNHGETLIETLKEFLLNFLEEFLMMSLKNFLEQYLGGISNEILGNFGRHLRKKIPKSR